jgi:hypothetical protein
MHTISTLSLTFIAALLLPLGCSYASPDNAEGGETGGDSKPNQGPPEVANPPEWHCRERIPHGTMVLADEGLVSARASEVCPFAIASHESDPLPGKPNYPGVPDMATESKTEFNQYVDNLPDELGANGHPMLVEPDHNAPSGWSLVANGDLRSGLIGNFAVWESIHGVPKAGLRPPIVTASFADILGAIQDPHVPTTLGDPLMSGRYNAYGFGCSTQPAAGQGSTAINVAQAPRQDAAECTAFIIWDNVSPVEPFPYLTTEHSAIAEAVDRTACLDNGGEYHPTLASPSGIVERQGLVWLNWNQLTLVQEYVNIHLIPLNLLSELNVFLDFLESIGFEYNYWPSDPVYPYANWSFTGVCAHPVELQEKLSDGSLRTAVPCPSTYVAVLPEFDFPDPDDDSTFSVSGYCTLPYAFPPGPNMAAPTAIPEITIGKPGGGFDGAIYLARPTVDTLARWLEAVAFDVDEAGIKVTARNALGRDLLDAVNVPDGSHIIGWGPPDVRALALRIDAALVANRISMIVLVTPNRRTLFRYLVPAWDWDKRFKAERAALLEAEWASLIERAGFLRDVDSTSTDDD